MSRRAARIGMTFSVGITLAGLAMIPGGCSMPQFNGIQDIPLPGGADLGNYPYTVTAEFKNVVSLVPQSSVKVNDVTVGRVTKITVGKDGWSAKVRMRVNGKVWLPANAYANVEQSSLLGEKYIQLVAPEDMRKRPDSNDSQIATAAAPANDRAQLKDGATIPLARTNRNPEVEEVFGALSLLLNGGGVQQISTITSELNKALGGNEEQAKSVLTRMNTLSKDLNKNKGNITKALDSINKLSSTLAARDTKIGDVLKNLTPGMKTLKDQRTSLVTMLRALDTLSTVAVDTIDKSKDDLVADLRALAPVLKNLADSGRDLPKSLQVMFTYPFTDEVLSGVKGDYLNVYLRIAARPGTEIVPPVSGGGSNGTRSTPLPLPSAGGES
ncbi:MCE family protein [Streptomyces sp. A7024]|uniref:MCE family protein n=1 Tax=Streptomyces coryli TaxID=1128680 RepID=A0A6G4U1E8_9ACTN|nr:MCE family protein [Streptomyces coryli]